MIYGFLNINFVNNFLLIIYFEIIRYLYINDIKNYLFYI